MYRLLLDLQGCQTRNSRHRGIGRYSLSLAKALHQVNATRQNPFDLSILLNGNFLEGAKEVEAEFSSSSSHLPVERFGPSTLDLGSISRQADILGLTAATAARAMRPDIIHVSSVFEGFEEGAAFPSYPSDIVGSAMRTATVYDLIPFLYPEKYLANPAYADWYRHGLESLRSYDLLFAISEATKQDIVAHLGVEANRIVNLSGAVDPRFRRIAEAEGHRSRMARQLGLNRKFVLYTGGADHRKNLEGAIDAFALLPRPVRQDRQLAIVCRIDDDTRGRLREHARQAGLSDGDLVLTGYVSDEDLVVLYNLAEIFVFPSVYEGFGLPVLEAMSCGAPTLVGDNSSLPEVAGRKDMLFDAKDPRAISAAMADLLENESLRRDLSDHGVERSKLFSWEACAERFLTGLDEHLVERGTTKQARRPRVAMLSPLPPARSGISDYTADLLAPLGRTMDLDLYLDAESLASPSIEGQKAFPWEQLPKRWRDYETVIYQLGNSTFHTHMLSLLPMTGGIVILHDVYLSNLKAWLDMHEGRGGYFRGELGKSHGATALEAFERRGHDTAIRDWPASGSELAAADAVIVHSEFALRLISRFFPTMAHKVRVVRQPRALPSEGTIGEARRRLGISEDAFVVVSIGMIGPSKRLDDLAAAFLLATDHRPEMELILVGEAGTDPWSSELRIKLAKANRRARITGHLPSEEFAAYCQACDVAVQLRGSTRGETSAAVLQLMAHEKPVVVNSLGDFADYPEDVVVKLSEQPSVREIADALKRLREMPAEERHAFGARAKAHVRNYHSHDVAAKGYDEVLRQVLSQDRTRKAFEALLGRAGGLAAETSSTTFPLANRIATALAPSASWLGDCLSAERRLLVDVSHTHLHDLKTGIQRVVRELTRSFYAASGHDGLNVQAFVRHPDGSFTTADGFALRLSGISAPDGIDGPLDVRPGDALLMLDSSWFEYDGFTPLFEAVRRCGGSIHTCVYDLVPIRHPELTGAELPPAFDRWLRRAALESDSLVCISRAVADEVVTYLCENGISHHPRLSVDWFHLGSDLPSHGPVSPRVEAALAEGPVVLMVGTVEVRKRHAFALNAMEELWRKDSQTRFVILGKEGWHVEEVTRRLRNHPEAGRRLFWIENPSDADIAHAYDQANVLLFPSFYEGYGLPVAEALRAGLPVIASDIPVLKEVGGNVVRYAQTEDLKAWVGEIEQATQGARHRIEGGIFQSWYEAAGQMRDTLLGYRRYRSPQKAVDNVLDVTSDA